MAKAQQSAVPEHRAPGWRGRIGYVSPSTIQLPWELQELLPEGVGVVATVLSVRAHTDAEFERARQGTRGAIQLVLGEGAQSVMLGGVPVAVRQGFLKEREQHRVWEAELGIPVISGVAAMVAGLRSLGARRPVVATAYLDEINRQIVAYLSEAELDVQAVRGLRVTTPAEASRVSPAAYVELALDLARANPAMDSVILCARGNVQPVLLQLEGQLDVPAVSGTQAGLWWALRQLGIGPVLTGGGRLMGGADAGRER